MSDTVPDDAQVEDAVLLAMTAPENVLRAVYRAVYEYEETHDPAVLEAFAAAAVATIAVHSSPEHKKESMTDEIKVGDKVRYANTYPHTRVYQVVYVGEGRAIVWHHGTGWFDASLSRLRVVERCLGWEPVPEPEPKWEPGDVIEVQHSFAPYEATLRKDGRWQSGHSKSTTPETISDWWAKGWIKRVTT